MKKVLGIVGRLGCLVAIMIFGAFVASEMFLNEGKDFFEVDLVVYVIGAMMVLVLIGFLLSFATPALGGWIIVLGGLFNGAFLYVFNNFDNILAVITFGLPFIVTGLMIVLSKKPKSRYY